jgi:hypothetical protein
VHLFGPAPVMYSALWSAGECRESKHSKNVCGGLAAGGCTVKRLAMLRLVGRKQRCACRDVPLECAADWPEGLCELQCLSTDLVAG